MEPTNSYLIDRMLRAAFSENLPVVLFFNKGTAIPKCRVLEFDETAILAQHGEVLQLFFRAAISSIEFPPGWVAPWRPAMTTEPAAAGATKDNT